MLKCPHRVILKGCLSDIIFMVKALLINTQYPVSLSLLCFQFSQTVNDPPQSKDSSSITINQNLSFEAVKKSVSTLEGQLEHFCQQEVMKISAGWSHSFSVFTLLMHVVTNSASSIFGMD